VRPAGVIDDPRSTVRPKEDPMSAVARHLHVGLLLATALLLVHPATTRADVDLTGSWTVYGTYGGAPTGPYTWSIT